MKTTTACLAAAAALLAVACGSSPAQRFYTLTPRPPPELATPIARLPEATIVVEAPKLSELVDRPQWVARRSRGEVSILEQQRWALPLRADLPRVVAENLAALLGAREVAADPAAPVPADAYRVGLEVIAFEMLPSDEVGVDIAWHIRQGARDVGQGRSQLREAIVGSDFEPAATAYSRALGAVSRDIAESLRAAVGR